MSFHLFLYFAGALSLSQSPVLARLAMAPASVVGSLRLSLAALVLLPIVVTRREPLARQNWVWLLLCGFFFFLHLWTFKLGAIHGQISNLMVLFATQPIWTALGSTVWLKHRLQKQQLVAFSLAFVGISFLFAQGFSWSRELWLGNLFSLGSAVFYAAYMVTSFRAREKVSNVNFAFTVYAVTALLFLLVTQAEEQALTGWPSRTYLAVIGLVVFPTLLGHFSFSFLVRHLDLNFMSCGKLVEPVIAALSAAWLFQEELTPQVWIAFFFTAASVIVLTFGKRFRARTKMDR